MYLVTTMNLKLFDEYGRRFIDTFENYAGNDTTLFVVFEGEIPYDFFKQNKKTQLIVFESYEHNKFIKYFGGLKEANGYTISKYNSAYLGEGLRVGFDYRFDAIKFSYKIFAIEIYREKYKEINFAWIDSDVVCHSTFTKSQISQFWPESDQIMAYLGRKNFPYKNPYSECGFLSFNAKHAELSNFLSFMKALYLTGEIFSLTEWRDSWLWDFSRKEFERRGFKFKNLSSNIPDCEHPFINCGLGYFFDHLKGPERKKLGKSFGNDLNYKN